MLARRKIDTFVVSVDGAFGREANSFVKHLSAQIAIKWGESHGQMTGWLRCLQL